MATKRRDGSEHIEEESERCAVEIKITNYQLRGSLERKHFPRLKRITNYQLRITWFFRMKTFPTI